MLGRQIGEQLDFDPALLEVQIEQVFRIDGGLREGAKGARDSQQRGGGEAGQKGTTIHGLLQAYSRMRRMTAS